MCFSPSLFRLWFRLCFEFRLWFHFRFAFSIPFRYRRSFPFRFPFSFRVPFRSRTARTSKLYTRPALDSSPIQAEQQAARTSQPLLLLLLLLFFEFGQRCTALHIWNQKRFHWVANIRFAPSEVASLDRFANEEERVFHEGGAEAKRATGERILEDGEVNAEGCVAAVERGERVEGLGVGNGGSV